MVGERDMARARRNFFSGGIYHVIQRGNNRAYIFNDQLDKAYFLNIVKEVKEKQPFEVLYYVIMDNHYHFVLRMNQAPIGDIMRSINWSYSKYFNQKYSRSGTIFGSKYSCIDIKDMRQLMSVILYNAYNPVKAKMVSHPEQYKWCAHLEVVSSRGYILNRSKLLEILDKNEEKAIKVYQNLLDQKIKGIKIEKSADEVRMIRDEVMKTLLIERCESDELANAVLTGNRTSKVITVKKQFVRTLLDKGFKTNEIAHYLNISDRAVRNLATPVSGNKTEVTIM